MDKIKAGQLPGPELSIAKLAGTMNMRRLGDFVSHVLGPKLVADTGEWGTYAWAMLVLGTANVCSACRRSPASIRSHRSGS